MNKYPMPIGCNTLLLRAFPLLISTFKFFHPDFRWSTFYFLLPLPASITFLTIFSLSILVRRPYQFSCLFSSFVMIDSGLIIFLLVYVNMISSLFFWHISFQRVYLCFLLFQGYPWFAGIQYRTVYQWLCIY